MKKTLISPRNSTQKNKSIIFPEAIHDSMKSSSSQEGEEIMKSKILNDFKKQLETLQNEEKALLPIIATNEKILIDKIKELTSNNSKTVISNYKAILNNREKYTELLESRHEKNYEERKVLSDIKFRYEELKKKYNDAQMGMKIQRENLQKTKESTDKVEAETLKMRHMYREEENQIKLLKVEIEKQKSRLKAAQEENEQIISEKNEIKNAHEKASARHDAKIKGAQDSINDAKCTIENTSNKISETENALKSLEEIYNDNQYQIEGILQQLQYYDKVNSRRQQQRALFDDLIQRKT